MEALNISLLAHIGTLNSAEKSAYSYEGNGLSVSQCPNAWRKIARLGGQTHLLEKPGAQFADFYSMDREVLDAWGVAQGLIESVTLFRVSYFDDELDREVYSDYLTREAAQEEADAMGDDEFVPQEVQGYQPTEKMVELVEVKTNHMCYDKHLFGLYVQVSHPDYDGVWFADELDVLGYSAPAGMIFKEKLSDWNISVGEFADEDVQEY